MRAVSRVWAGTTPAAARLLSGDTEAVSVRVEVHPALLQWARGRSGIDEEVWPKRFPHFDEWVVGDKQPTMRQLQEFAAKTYTPVGFLLLDEPPVESLPVADFRMPKVVGPSVAATGNLLDTLYAAQARQEWYRDNQLLHNELPVGFVGSATTSTPPERIGASIREALGWTSDVRHDLRSRQDALAQLRERAEDLGVLVMISGIVGANTHRKLDPGEFRGFALADDYAPLVFVNGADAKSAQIFTLAHELAHLWLGASALSDVEPESSIEFAEERWCNAVAAELLVPMAEFRHAFDPVADLRGQLEPLAQRFRVSTQVILARAREAGGLNWDEFMFELDIERRRIAALRVERSSGGGGNYYSTKPIQVGKRFARDLLVSTFEGRTSFTEAFRLLDVKKVSTLEGLGRSLGVL